MSGTFSFRALGPDALIEVQIACRAPEVPLHNWGHHGSQMLRISWLLVPQLVVWLRDPTSLHPGRVEQGDDWATPVLPNLITCMWAKLQFKLSSVVSEHAGIFYNLADLQVFVCINKE